MEKFERVQEMLDQKAELAAQAEKEKKLLKEQEEQKKRELEELYEKRMARCMGCPALKEGLSSLFVVRGEDSSSSYYGSGCEIHGISRRKAPNYYGFGESFASAYKDVHYIEECPAGVELEIEHDEEERLEKLRQKYFFLLGGYDGEMAEIKRVLDEYGFSYADNDLEWGANIDSYDLTDIESTIVAIELDGVEQASESGMDFVDVNHHGDRADEPAALIQVLGLLGLEPTRKQSLIAANDSGFIPAMEKMGATLEEIAEVRALDREAQGITAEQEAEAERAIAEREEIEIGGRKLTIVRMEHSKTATVTDRLYGSYDQLIIISDDGETNFFGDGELCQELQGKDTGEKTPEGYPIYDKFGGWTGGEGLGKAGETAYWGGYADQAEVLGFVRAEMVTELDIKA